MLYSVTLILLRFRRYINLLPILTPTERFLLSMLMRYVYSVSQKSTNLAYCLLCVCQISTDFSKKIGRHVLEETLNKSTQKVLTSSQMCASTTLGNLT